MLFTTAFAHAQTIEQIYHFGQPEVSSRDGYQQINLVGCLPNGQVGEPTLPWQSVSLILPEGQEAVSMSVEFLDYVEMEGIYKLYPYQKPRPYSNEKEIPFAKNEQLYRSTDAYPTRTYGDVSTQYLNGVAFAFGGFTPVQYVPSTGKVSIAHTAIVRVETTTSRDDRSGKLWLTPENKASIERLAQNAGMLSSYNRRGREISGYDMLIITAESWIPSFSDYLDLYNGKGIRTQIVSLEEIYASMSGRDNQEKIRNYIIQEYENNGITMVNLGGDISIVPFRPLWCWAQDEEEDQLPADMYYACLDGTLNDDNDDRWGEVGEDDLLPELGIGRLPFNNEAQFEAIMHKTLSYLSTPVLGEFTSPVFGAEHLGDGYYGSTDIERLIGTNDEYGYTTIGYPEDYNFKRYYESPSNHWSGNAFRNVIGTGGQYVHHAGHANAGIVANWDVSTVTGDYFANNNGIDHNYMMFHSHGCICGDFSHNCILEKLVTIPTGFVVATGNSRYGWYVPWGDGMAAHIHREFIDAYCNDHIPSVGMALREAKIMTAPWVTAYGENGCMRWNLYCLNVLGDGALCPWFEEPIIPDVSYQQGIPQGTTSTSVSVKTNGTPLSGHQVNIFKGELLLARSFTDNNGIAILNFDDPTQLEGELNLIVNGQNLIPQCYPVKVLTDEPFLFVENYDFFYENNNTGTLIAGQTYELETDVTNPSLVDLANVDVTVSCNDEQVEVLQNHFVLPSIPAGTNITGGQRFTFRVSDQATDQARILMDVTCSAEGQSWTTSIPLYLNAPVLQFADIELDDSMGDNNGYADPGERITLHINVKNAGHALANGTYLTASCNDERLHLDETAITCGNIDTNGNYIADLVFTTNGDTPNGTSFFINLALHTGSYITDLQKIIPVGVATETFESGDFSYIGWNHGGVQPWFITDQEAHSGSYCAQSGEVGYNQTSELVIYADVLQDGEISFFLKTATVYHKDYLVFYIDRKLQSFWSGDTDWTRASFSFESGSHEFLWLYKKKSNDSSDLNCVWIDDITFPRASVITNVVESPAPKSASLYPNPCKGSCYLQLDEESDVTVFNILGQKIADMQKVEGTQQINLEDMPKGLYLIQISNTSGVQTLKVISE